MDGTVVVVTLFLAPTFALRGDPATGSFSVVVTPEARPAPASFSPDQSLIPAKPQGFWG